MVSVARRQPFQILYDPVAVDHLKTIDRKYHALFRRTIEEQLAFEPETETRNRKPLLREIEFDADWELRLGPDNRFRVLYAVDSEHRRVEVLAIGVKRGNQLYVGRKKM